MFIERVSELSNVIMSEEEANTLKIVRCGSFSIKALRCDTFPYKGKVQTLLKEHEPPSTPEIDRAVSPPPISHWKPHNISWSPQRRFVQIRNRDRQWVHSQALQRTQRSVPSNFPNHQPMLHVQYNRNNSFL